MREDTFFILRNFSPDLGVYAFLITAVLFKIQKTLFQSSLEIMIILIK